MNNRWIVSLSLVGMLLLMGACADGENTATEEPAPGPVGDSSPIPQSTETQEADEPPTSGTPVTGSGLCANAYYPVREGATWTYAGSSTASDDYTFTNTITSVRSDGFSVIVKFDEVTLTQEWACTPEGILALESGGGGAGTVTTDNLSLVIDTQNASGLTYPAEIQAGSTWQHTLDYSGTMEIAGQSGEAQGNTIYDYTAIGVESVSVPAGTFEAMKIDIVTTINITATFQDTTMPLTLTSTGASWFVQGVGWVKSVSQLDMAGIQSTDTIVLQSYSIP